VPSTLQGGYAQANYYFWPEFLNGTFLAKHFPDPKFTAVFRYDFARIADDQDAGTVANKEQRYTIGMNYRPVQNYVFKVEYQFNTTRSEALERGTANGVVTSITAAF
jgi:opacity protein-like surface antigen